MGTFTISEDLDEMPHCGISSGPTLFVKVKIFRQKMHFFLKIIT